MLSTCKKEGAKSDISPRVSSTQLNENRQAYDNLKPAQWLKQVDAQTPYFMGNVSPLQGSDLERALEFVRTSVDCDELAGSPTEKVECEVFMKRMTKQGLSDMGFGDSLSVGIYGVGLMPVARLTIADRKKFEATVTPLFKEGWTKSGSDGVTTWTTTEDDLTFQIAITDREASFGLSPTPFEKEMRDHLIGKSAPKNSLVPEVVTLGKTYGFDPRGLIGFGDATKVARLLEPSGTSLAHKMAQATLGKEVPKVCVDAFADGFTRTPRAVFGYDDINNWSGRFIIEMKKSLINELKKLPTQAPSFDIGKLNDSAMLLGFGIGTKHLSDGLDRWEKILQNIEKACPRADNLTTEFSQIRMGLSMVEITGGYLAIDDMKMGKYGDPEKFTGHGGVYTKSALAALAMMGMKDKANGKWNDLGAMGLSLLADDEKAMFAAGKGRKKEAEAAMKKKRKNAPWFEMAWDQEKYMNMLSPLSPNKNIPHGTMRSEMNLTERGLEWWVKFDSKP